MNVFQNLPHLEQENRDEIVSPQSCKSCAWQRTVWGRLTKKNHEVGCERKSRCGIDVYLETRRKCTSLQSFPICWERKLLTSFSMITSSNTVIRLGGRVTLCPFLWQFIDLYNNCSWLCTVKWWKCVHTQMDVSWLWKCLCVFWGGLPAGFLRVLLFSS